MGKKWIGHARLLAEVLSTSIEYCELYKFQKKNWIFVGPPGPLFIPTCKSLGWENVVFPSNQVTVSVSTTKKHVHINFYGTIIGLVRTCVSAQISLCANIVLFVQILS